MDDLDKIDRRLILKGIQSLKSEACYEKSRLGFYLEDRLSPEDRAKIENHLKKCLYCLDQLTEIRELIYLEKSCKPFTADQIKKFSQMLDQGKQETEKIKPLKENLTVSFGKKIGSLFFPSFRWKDAVRVGFLMLAISLASMYVTIKIKNPDILSSGTNAILTAEAEKNIKQSGVKVDLLDPSGKNFQTIPGVVIDSNGLVLTNLKDLKKANSARVTFADGNSLPVVGVQVDEARNLAVLKVSQKNLVSVKVTRPKRLQVGDQFIHILDPTDPSSTASHVTITRVSTPEQSNKKEHHYIEITGQKPISPKAILVNPEGETVGKVITGEGMVGSAVIFDVNETFAPSETFIPISLIGK